MNDYHGFDDGGNWFSRLPAPVRAALLVVIGLLILNTITFITAGTGAAVSLPLMALVYLGCGVLGAAFGVDAHDGRTPVVSGAMAGLTLWLFSFLIDILLTVLLSAPSLGVSLVVGVPYLCLCGPTELFIGAILGSFGGLLYGFFHDSGSDDSLFSDF